LRSYPKTFIDSSAMMWRRKRELLGGVWSPVIVTPSQWLGNLASEASAGRCRVKVIPNGIDTQLFQPRDRSEVREELGLPDGKKVVLFAAADLADERKGARYFFECLNFVQANEWMAVTVGKRIDVRRMLNRQVEIKQLGYVAGSEAMAKVYNAADLFCITSLDDNFPTTVLESLACGTPVVGFRVGGIPEQVTDDCGILVEPRDAQGLGKAITQLLQDDVLREKMSENCRDRAVAEYSVSKFSDRYLKEYDKAIEGDKR
jgi:glycosyltransferase involved in cell wall biosynthesis